MPVLETGSVVPPAGGDAAWGRRPSRRDVLAGLAAAGLVAGLPSLAKGAPGERRLALYNPHTDERFADVYWCDGQYVPDSLTRIDWLMRDFHRNVVAQMDPQLLDLLHRIHARLDTNEPLQILSGYRTAATNRLLRIDGHGAAAHSLHVEAQAADINIDRVGLKRLRRAALSLRAGGVGTYWHEHFVHVDVGPVRSWRG